MKLLTVSSASPSPLWWRTFNYILRELPKVPTHVPVCVLGNYRDMGEHRVILPGDVRDLIDNLNRWEPSAAPCHHPAGRPCRVSHPCHVCPLSCLWLPELSVSHTQHLLTPWALWSGADSLPCSWKQECPAACACQKCVPNKSSSFWVVLLLWENLLPTAQLFSAPSGWATREPGSAAV